MQLEALQIFLDVVRLRSVSQAASANGLTQSAVSQLVRQLEERLGVELLDRSIRPVGLTPEGQRYFEGCKELIERYREIEAGLRQSARERAMTVQVAAIYSVGLRDMNHYVTLFAAQEPGASVHIECLHPDRVYERVLDGTADLGILSFPRKSRDLVSLPWRDEEMVLVCQPGHPLAALARVPISRLVHENYIHFNRDLVIRKRVDRFLRQHGVQVTVALEFDNIENIKHAIDVSSGVALLPWPTVEREVHAGTLAARPLADAKMVRSLAIIHRRRQRLTSAARRFIELLRQPEEPDSSTTRTQARSARKRKSSAGADGAKGKD